MNKKFKISDFENFFNSAILDDGLDLSHLKNDWKVEEIKGKLSAVFNEKGLKPVNVLIDKTKEFVLNYKCDCFHFAPNKGCKHIAGLLYLGKNKNVRLIPVNEIRKVGIDDLIEVMAMDELSGFLKFYASNNIVFNKLFKQYFSYKFIPYGKSFSDYINQLSLSYMDVNGKYDMKSKKQLHQIFEMHLLRADQMMSQSDWTGAVEIITSLLSRIFQFNFEENNKSLDYLIDKSHRNLVTASAQQIAPSLKRKINKLATELISSSGYNYFNENNAIRLAGLTLEDNYSFIRESIEERYQQALGKDKSRWLVQLYLFMTHTKNFELLDFYTDHMDSDIDFAEFLDRVNEQNIKDATIHRMIEIKILKMDEKSDKKLLHSTASYLINSSKETLYLKLSEFLFSVTLDEEILNSKILFSVAIENSSFAKTIASSRYFKKIDESNAGLYNKLLLNSGKLSELIKHYNKFGDFEQIIPVLEVLLAHDVNQTMDLILNKIKEYLDTHVGSQSTVVVEEVIQLLSKKMLYEEVKMLIDFLKINFYSRKNLMKSIKHV